MKAFPKEVGKEGGCIVHSHLLVVHRQAVQHTAEHVPAAANRCSSSGLQCEAPRL